MVYDDNSDEEDNLSYRSDEDELLNDNRSSELDEEEEEEEEALGNDSDYLEELPPDEDDASYCTESSFRSHSTMGSTPGEQPCRGAHARTLAECCCLAEPHCSKWSCSSESGLCLPPLHSARSAVTHRSPGCPPLRTSTLLSRFVLHFAFTPNSII